MSAPEKPGPPWRAPPQPGGAPGDPLGRLLEEARAVRPPAPGEMERAWGGAARAMGGGAAPRAAIRRPLGRAGVGSLELSPDAEYRIEAEHAVAAQRIFLSRGTLLAQVDHQSPGAAVMVEAPQLEVVVVGTRFRVTVEPRRSRVEVLEGRVRAGHPGGTSVLVAAGEAVASDDPRLEATVPAKRTVAPLLSGERVAVPACGAASAIDERRTCYRAGAAGSGLAAQNALFALAQLDRDEAKDPRAALASFQEYEQRFPHGTFAPEAALGELEALLQLGQLEQALAAAHGFLEGNPTDARQDRVKLIEAQLRQEKQDLRVALELYRDLSRVARYPDVLEEALYERGVCEAALGDGATARATFAAYQSRFPQGPHAGDVAARLHP